MNTSRFRFLSLVSVGISILAMSIPQQPAFGLDEISRLRQENTALKAEIAKLKAPKGGAAAKAGATVTATAAANATASGYTDIADVFGEQEIKNLVAVGILPKGTTFEPSKPITRAEFIMWLVKANNKLRKDGQIRIADANSKSTFPDVPSSHPMFRYIQGISNAGWAVGYDDQLFKPDQELTREEMIAIKMPIDRGSTITEVRPAVQMWTDYKTISERFLPAMAFNATWPGANWERVFGQTKICEPQKPVTRAEAAVCVSAFGISKSNAATIQALLKK
jgi:hypothetical protein